MLSVGLVTRITDRFEVLFIKIIIYQVIREPTCTLVDIVYTARLGSNLTIKPKKQIDGVQPIMCPSAALNITKKRKTVGPAAKN